MTRFLNAAAMLAALLAAGAAQGQPARTVASKNVCLRTIDIRDTKVIDSRTSCSR